MIAPHVKAAVPLHPYVVRVVFAEGEVRDVDIEPLLSGEIFRPLTEPGVFEKVAVDEYGETIVWPTAPTSTPRSSTGSLSRRANQRPCVSVPERA